MKIDFSKVIFRQISRCIDLMDGPKKRFYPIQMCLWLKRGNKEVVVWWYELELSTKSLLDHSKLIENLNWTVLTIVISWRFSLYGTSPSLAVSKWSAPFHVSKLTWELFEHKRFTGEKVMEWPPSSLDLNLIKSLRSIVKMKL